MNVQKSQQGNQILFKISGPVDDSVDFEAVFGPLEAGEWVLHLAGVDRINSVGIKKWIQYFENSKFRNTHLIMRECSPVIVEQLNLLPNFHCGAVIESVYLPFSCECGKEFTVCKPAQSLKGADLDNLTSPCPQCGKAGEFDDIPEEYFVFLTR